jgi:hypothetical protein
MARRRAGSIMVIVGAFVFLGAQTFLAYIETGGPAYTAWDLSTRQPVILTVIGVVTLVLATASLLSDSATAEILVASCSFYLFGRVFPIGARSYSYLGIGFWLASGATAVMSAGAIVAVTGRPSLASRFAKPS